jgi:hypothetical protein
LQKSIYPAFLEIQASVGNTGKRNFGSLRLLLPLGGLVLQPLLPLAQPHALDQRLELLLSGFEVGCGEGLSSAFSAAAEAGCSTHLLQAG